jgi:hypothetical protein
MITKPKGSIWRTSVVVLSLLLIFVTLPHTLSPF